MEFFSIEIKKILNDHFIFKTKMECFQERALYYWRHGLYGHVQRVCELGLGEKPSNLFLYMFIALSKGKRGKLNDAFEIMSRMKQRKDLALIYEVVIYCLHISSPKTTNEELETIRKNIHKAAEFTNPLALYYATLISWLFDLSDFYNFFIEKNNSFQNPNPSMKTLCAWILLTSSHHQDALAQFDEILVNHIQTYDIMALYGKAVCHTIYKQYSESIQVITKILSKYNFPELHIEKCRVYMANDRWDFAKTIVDENKDAIFSTIEADLIIAMEGIYNGKNSLEIAEVLDSLYEGILLYEKENWQFSVKVSSCLLTMCTHNLMIIDRILKIATLAYEASNNNSVCSTVMGFAQLYAYNYVAALHINCDQPSKDCLPTMPIEFQIRLLIDTNRFTEAEDLLDLYQIIGSRDLVYCTLRAKLLRKTNNTNEPMIIPVLNALKYHLANFRLLDVPFGSPLVLEMRYEQFCEFFLRFRIDVIIESLEEIVLHNQSIAFSLSKNIGKEIVSFFEPYTKSFPKFTPFQFFMAILLEEMKMYDESLLIVQKILLAPTIYKLSECLTIAARLYYRRGQNENAMSCLENASAEDPSLMKSIDFLILKSQVTSTEKETLQLIIPLLDTNRPSFNSYLSLIDLCISINEYDITADIMKKASDFITHSSEKIKLILRQMHIFAHRKEEEKAIQALEKLQKHKKFEIDAVKTKAEIYQKYLNDNVKYVAVYHEYANEAKSPESFILLGDALRKTKSFNLAIDAYKRSLKKHPSDIHVLQKILMCCISSHRFDEAVGIFINYSHIFRNSYLFSFGFIKIMIEMKRYTEAEQCITKVTRIIHKNNLLTQVGFYELLGMMKSHLKEYSASNEHIKVAVNTYTNILETANTNAYTNEIKNRCSDLIYHIGMNYMKLQEREKAIENFTQSLSLNPLNIDSVIALFEIYKARHDSDHCRKICIDYLEIDPTNETVALLLTSTQTAKLSEYAPYLQNVLDAHPTYYRALVRLVEISARCGNLQFALRYIKKGKSNDPGFYFVRGLYAQFVGNNEKARRLFKHAMNGQRWEIPAKIALFYTLINPDRKFCVFEDQPLSSNNKMSEAADLLKTIRTDEITHDLLYCDLLTSKNSKESIDEASVIYNNLMKLTPGSVPASVGMARCYAKQGDYEKATSILNFVLAGKPFHETFSFFEEAYLIRAHIVTTQTNFSSAQHFILLALELDMCCKKGWEMSAQVNMKRKMYQEAAVAYGYCWQLCDHKDPEVGYNYAYCSMKAKNYDNALIICRGVMDIYPEYKDLREKVMIPSYHMIKS
ncbi:TPR Domain containing protein [Tritrichomonas foetus]|uniref:TPR Domain containing protein n=1 Tax=Tritrichomonas foetus TaxID=1144522 RepID=A0A1J4L4B7_9EUKA|nr:TPR Domain containing protein [Tritrichomonas foetus]|eukprot:OHT16820.1 TPR Domain containing protein [Tritrichomonas foetus]